MLTSFLSPDQITDLTGQFSNHFTTFSSGINNVISVIKQPQVVINNPSETVIEGYGAVSMNVNDTQLNPITGFFPAMLIYPNEIKQQQFGQLKFPVEENSILVKVEPRTKDFILNGKTEGIIANDIYYGIIDIVPRIQSYFGLKYYYFKLTVTK